MEHPHFDSFGKFIHFFKKWCTFNVLRKRSCNVYLSIVLYNFNIFPKKGNAAYLVYNIRINTILYKTKIYFKNIVKQIINLLNNGKL